MSEADLAARYVHACQAGADGARCEEDFFFKPLFREGEALAVENAFVVFGTHFIGGAVDYFAYGVVVCVLPAQAPALQRVRHVFEQGMYIAACAHRILAELFQLYGLYSVIHKMLVAASVEIFY